MLRKHPPAHRREPDHPSWGLKEDAARTVPHRTREVALQPLSGNAERELLHALVGPGTLPGDMDRRILESAEGNPFFLEEIVRSLADAGALVARTAAGGSTTRFPSMSHQTVEKVILARADRLDAEVPRRVLGGLDRILPLCFRVPWRPPRPP